MDMSVCTTPVFLPETETLMGEVMFQYTFGCEHVIVRGCRSTEGLRECDMHAPLGILQRPEHHRAEGDGCRRDPPRNRRPHSGIAA